METVHDTDGPPNEMAEAAFRVVVTGEGVNIDRPTTQNAAIQIIRILMGGAPADHAPGSPQQNPTAPTLPEFPPNGRTLISAGEYISEVEAKTNTEKILAFGAYLRSHKESTTFTRDEIKSLFQAAGEPPPRNFPRDFKAAISNRWIAQETGSKNEFFVTTTGLKAIEQKFPETAVKKSRRASRPKNRSKGMDANTKDETG